MDITQELTQQAATFVFKGAFTFSDHEDIKGVLDACQPPVEQVTLDFRAVNFVDSAALGMLLLVKDEAEKHSIKLSIRGAQEQPMQMFQISRFNELFDLVA
ncbi:STAS domain-containing protein [bacterium]|nr:STAS domain-containing protein [bacterium]